MASQENKVSFNDDKFKKILKGLKEAYTVRVGILGSNANKEHRNSKGLTNADIGEFHEFGKGNNPRRSFLYDSLLLKLKFNNSQMRKMRIELFKQFFVKGTPYKFMRDLGAYALKIVSEAFATNGFGRWKPWSDEYRRYRASLVKGKRRKKLLFTYGATILTLTGQLRKSINFDVKKVK